jgi:hypothetical protein
MRAPAHPIVQHLEFSAQPDGDGMFSHQDPRLGIHIGAAAGREYMYRAFEQALDDPPFAVAELGLAESFEEF